MCKANHSLTACLCFYYSTMNIIPILWMCLIIVSQPAHSLHLMVTVNSNGTSSIFCCLFGFCTCNSFSNALFHIQNNTMINIISPVVSLDTLMHIQRKSNITITSKDGTKVICSGVGSLVFSACSDVTIEAVTWDHCGDMKYPNVAGVGFYDSISNISIINCTFQQFTLCATVYVEIQTGDIKVVNSKFIFNAISSASVCHIYSTLLVTSSGDINIVIYNSMFYLNGNSSQGSGISNGSLFIVLRNQITQSVLIKNSSFISNGIRSMYIIRGTKIIFDEVIVSNNRFGTFLWVYEKLDVISSQFTWNKNGALDVWLRSDVKIELFNSTFANNSATANTFGTALYVITSNNSTVSISLCNFYDNVGGNSIVYINSLLPFDLLSIFDNVLISSSNFKNNKNGSALQVAKSFLTFNSTTLFQDNSAKSGAAVYITESSQISVDDGSMVQFINNTASLRGGALYIDLTNCHDHGIVFTNFTRYDSISFIKNSAKLSGNSIYFDIPNSCDVIRDYTNNDSAAYVPYKFTYIQSRSAIGPAIATSPYEIKLCSTATKSDCSKSMNNSLHVTEDEVMLGQPIYFNTTLYDYFNTAAEATNLQVNCINCGFKYRPLDNEVLVQNGSSNRLEILSTNANTGLENHFNITLNLSSSFSPEYKQLIATLAITLSPCYNGYIFNKVSQQCECYSKDDQVQCEEDNVSIKLGYWFGKFSGKHSISLCHNNYCNFFTHMHRKETRTEFYNLPKEIDDQCNSHRTGVACGQCSEGYTLAYNSPDCIGVKKCSSEMFALVVVLTTLYWIVMISMLFGVAYFLNTQQISLGYLYGITFFYSIVDILLVTNLHLTDAVFYTATILSSFAKLNPQFLGRLCFIENLDAVDQQFIHYCHVVFISIILIIIYFMARCNNRALLYVNRGIMQVTCFILLFSYTSSSSASLLLLRAMKFKDIDGLYTYLSPHLKYFANRHAAYASVAILCVLLITIGFPLLLVLEPLLVKVLNKHFNNDRCIAHFLKRQVCFARIKLLLDQFQECYKDQHRWFAAYYLICRLVIMLITYYANGDYNYMIYYLQTACVIIAMTHIWIQPYKNDLLNVMDTLILMIMLLVVNINASGFSTSTTTAIAICLILSPLVLLLVVGFKKLLTFKFMKIQPNLDDEFDLELRPIPK